MHNHPFINDATFPMMDNTAMNTATSLVVGNNNHNMRQVDFTNNCQQATLTNVQPFNDMPQICGPFANNADTTRIIEEATWDINDDHFPEVSY